MGRRGGAAGGARAAELQAERDSLERSARASTDVVARRQLEAAAASLAEEVERLGDMRQRRERILARLRAEVALLERARVALLSLRSGQAQLKAAELASLARRFRALSTAQGEEGQAMDAVAAQVTLTQVAPVEAAPVTPVDPAPLASDGAKVPEIQRIQGE
ncbi:hypothetical protein [Corallococcus sp. 4LFB]|uniref:hypothetical protein n=1 Tax=Corallococcus sp. 4LFB TaxID=3383249 RepID=UPI003975EF1B